jgi:hypothetical protein
VALAGVAVGLVAAIAATRVLSSLLCDVSDRDPVTFASVTAILIAVSAHCATFWRIGELMAALLK